MLDPNKLDPTGGTAIDWFVPSHDGKLVADCLSKNGSEDGTLHFFETETGRKLADGTYLCNPFSTRIWAGRNAPHPVMASEPARIEMRFVERIPAGTPLPSPYNPPRYRKEG